MGDIIVGIDIGTSKAGTLIGRINSQNQVEILGKGLDLCTGVKKGTIVDIESTSNSIKASVRQAEEAAGMKIVSAYVTISGLHLTVMNHQNWIDVANNKREIVENDVIRVLDAARNITAPEGSRIIDIIPRYYLLEGCEEIVDPIGMVGARLGVEADVIAAKIPSVRNIMKCMEKCGIQVAGLIVEALATGEMVLTHDEKEMGVLLIDVGGETTDLSFIRNNNLILNTSIPVGGENITNDIAIGLKTPYAEAEKIKKQYDLALTSLIKFDQDFLVSDISDNSKKSIRISEMVNIIEARVCEIFSLCRNVICEADIDESSISGIVLAGRGIAHFDGAAELAGEIFDASVRVVSSKGTMGIQLEDITAAGVIKYGSTHFGYGTMVQSVASTRTDPKRKRKKGFLETIVNFFRNLF